MRQWHCMTGGQNYGPIDEPVLRQWIAEGRVGPDDYVWTQGMEQWDSVIRIFGGPADTGGSPPGLSMTPTVSPGGTNGQTPNSVLMAQARASLRGRWGEAIGFCLLMWLLMMAAGVASMCGLPVNLIVAGPIMLGVAIYFLTFTRGGRVQNDMLFAGFKNFGHALGGYILMYVFVMLWMFLLIVPGIIAALAYSQLFYLQACDRALGPMEALRESKRLMDGRKWKLFCLGWRFFGWSLLCMLTCGIGYLWLMPYFHASLARFFDDLQPPRAQPQAAVPPPLPGNPMVQ